jgi:transcriptional regulator with XRE-family HTH domain
MTTGERIADLRKKHSLTQPVFADKMNVSQSTITSWENDRRNISAEDLKKMANLFDVSTDYILGVTDEPRTKATLQKQAALDDKQTVLTFEGKPIPEDDRELMLRLLRGGRK